MALDLTATAKVQRPAAEEAPEAIRPSPAATRQLHRILNVQLGRQGKGTLEELVFTTRQLALLLETGNGLVPSIEAIAKPLRPSDLRTALLQVHDRLTEGAVLSECLAQHPRTFDDFYVSVARAGESSGTLRQSLERLVQVLEIRRQLQNRFREAMTYPIVLTVIMVAVVIFMLTYMFPKFKDLFADLGDEVPAMTRVLLSTGDFLRSRWMFVIPITVVVAVAACKLLRRPAAKRAWDGVKVVLPGVGGVFRKAYLFQVFSSLGMLLGSRVPHLEAIQITRRSVRNVRYERFFAKLAEHVEDGHGVSLAFQESAIFPQTVKLMVSTGEASGALDRVMTRLSEHYREELESDIRRLSSMIEPVMLVIMGILVGSVAVSFIVPLIKLSRGVH